MKRLISISLVILMAVSCLAFVSCGSGSSGDAETAESTDIGNPPSADSPYIGTWQPVRAEIEGMDNFEATFEDAPFTFELQEDGTAIVTKDKSETGTWTEKSNGVHITAGDTDDDFEDVDGQLIVNAGGFTIIFEKKE